jgi:hypothetical protein
MVMALLAVSVFAQSPFLSNGERFDKDLQKTRKPIVVVDTVRITAGYGTLGLNKSFKSKKQHSVAPTSANTLYATITPILLDTTKTVYSYGYVRSRAGDSLTIKSSGAAADTCSVVVHIYLR